MMHLMAKGTFVLAIAIIPDTLKLVVVIVHALCAVLHFSWIIARFAINSSPHKSVSVPGGHGTVPV